MIIVAITIIINIFVASWTCPAGTTNFNSIHELKYSYTGNSGFKGYRALLGQSTGDIYQVGHSFFSGTNASFIIRFSDPNTITWSKFYDNVRFAIRSIWIDPNESVIYSFELSSSRNYAYIYGFHTENGTVAHTKRINDSEWIYDVWWLIVSPDNTLYATFFSIGRGWILIWQIGS